ncbi:glycosyltransferase [Rhizobium etli]|nr:glycosyltransferase [Rhizobium etli]
MYSPLHDVSIERVRATGIHEPSSDRVNLVFASDRNYLPYTAVTLASILKNYKGSKAIHVYLLVDQKLDDQHVAKFTALKEIHGFDFHEIDVDASQFANIRTSAGISIATYYRLLMHKLLPKDVHKVLYLDSDLIILDSIDSLFDEKFDGAVFAGVEDSISTTYNKRFGIPASGRHINAGVMLVNIDAMRRIRFDGLVERYLEANRYRLTLGDQQIIAELFFDAIRYVPVKWNVHGSMFAPNWIDSFVGSQNAMDATEAAKAISSPSLIHYTLARKPWMSLEHPESDKWFKYLALTPYAAEISKPQPYGGGAKKPGTKNPEPMSPLRHFFAKYIPGTAISIARLRRTRLDVNKLNKRVTAIENVGRASPGTAPGSAVELKSILVERARNLPNTFSAGETIGSLAPNSQILSNVNKSDMDGGYAENIKTAMKTAKFSFFKDRAPDAVFLLSQRINQTMFWDCIRSAYLYDRPLYFVEVALFGAFSSYFDADATLNERRALGFMIDDMGYYFDARQPSRIERTLNDPSFVLTEAETSRARAAISRICAERITKYNRYIDSAPYHLERDAVLIIDQKKGDASIEFSGATDQTFADMLDAAIRDNPGKPVYFKRHPDSIYRNMNSYRDRTRSAVTVLPDDVSIGAIIDQCEAVYTVSSQVGFEALMRNKRVVTFGIPFFSGWGLTDDRMPISRRTMRRSIEEIFYVSCIKQSIYVDASSGALVEIEKIIDIILQMRADRAARS